MVNFRLISLQSYDILYKYKIFSLLIILLSFPLFCDTLYALV